MQHTCARRPLAFALASLTTLSILLALSPVSPARACSPPPTFGELLDMSDLIVTGSVVEVAKGTIKYGNESQPITIATIRIADTIKGSVDGAREIRVANIDETDFNLVINDDGDPGDPPAVPLSMRTGLFLLTAGVDEAPDSIGRWYGMKVYDITEDSARDAIVPIVRSHAALDAIADPLKRQVAFLEWIVECAENPMTRRDGFYEFTRADDNRRWRVASEDESDRDDVEAKVEFTDGQIDRLLDVWLEALEKRDDGAMWFGNALGEYRGELVASRLLDAIATAGESNSDDIGAWMQTVASIYEWRSGQLLAQQLWESEDRVKRTAILKQFLELAPIRGEIPEALVPDVAEDEEIEYVEDVESQAITEMEDVEREAVESIEVAGTGEEVGNPMDLVDLGNQPVIELESPSLPDGRD